MVTEPSEMEIIIVSILIALMIMISVFGAYYDMKKIQRRKYEDFLKKQKEKGGEIDE